MNKGLINTKHHHIKKLLILSQFLLIHVLFDNYDFIDFAGKIIPQSCLRHP